MLIFYGLLYVVVWKNTRRVLENNFSTILNEKLIVIELDQCLASIKR